METIEELLGRCIVSIRRGNEKNSKLSSEVLSLIGGSSAKNRHLLNNLCSYKDVRYLEVGTSWGSTLISALFKNSVKSCLSLDIWVEKKTGKDGKEKLIKNCLENLQAAPLLGSDTFKNNFVHIDGDCFEQNLLERIDEKYNVYFYDAGHEIDDHRRSISHFLPVLDDHYIMIIDDWNDHRVQEGTFKGLQEANISIHLNQYLPGRPGATPPSAYDQNEWYNGLMVLVCSKNK